MSTVSRVMKCDGCGVEAPDPGTEGWWMAHDEDDYCPLCNKKRLALRIANQLTIHRDQTAKESEKLEAMLKELNDDIASLEDKKP